MYSLHNSKIDQNKISQLIDKLGYLLKECNIELDSRKVDSSSIFCAYPGNKSDGRDFIADVIKRGVKYIIQEGNFDLSVDNNYKIENLREYVGLLASYKYNYPSKKFKTIGVTGTNGKTSITQWLAQIYTNLGKKSAVIGTVGSGIYPSIKDSAATTPDPITLQRLCHEFLNENVYLAAMEVSSHALDQGRVNGIQFETAIFTNLTQDHLDYHLTIENYYQAKSNFFYWQQLQNLIINIDDTYGKHLYDGLKAENTVAKIITYGLNCADVTATDIVIGLNGTRFTLKYNLEKITITANVIGIFNVYNILAVASYMILDGYSLKAIADAIGAIKPVVGRMDAIFSENKPLVIVDFAHSPDALKNVLQSLHNVESKGRIFCVFGCGGDRDKSKRPIMGEIVVNNADYAIVTSDNPRTEDPKTIIDQIISGISVGTNNFAVISDRKKAIEHAVAIAEENDIILIAGKGHEEYQEINGVKHHFSDFEVVRDALSKYSNN